MTGLPGPQSQNMRMNMPIGQNAPADLPGDRDARKNWEDLFVIYGKVIYGAASQSGLLEAEAQAVVQEVVSALARHMAQIGGGARITSAKHWLRRTTWQRMANVRPSCGLPLTPEHNSTDASPKPTVSEQAPDPAARAFEAVWEEEWVKHLMRAALERVKRRADPRQFQMFDFCVLKQWPVSKVASTLRVQVTEVYLAKQQLSGLLCKAIRDLEEQVT